MTPAPDERKPPETQPRSQLRVTFGAPVSSDVRKTPIPVRVMNDKAEIVSIGKLYLDEPLIIDDLPHGTYLIQAFLPSQEVLTVQARLVGNSTQEVRLQPRRSSPGEDLAWSYYLKTTKRSPGCHAVHQKLGLGSESFGFGDVADSLPEFALWSVIKGLLWKQTDWQSTWVESMAVSDPGSRARLSIPLKKGYGWLQLNPHEVDDNKLSKFTALPSSSNLVRVNVLWESPSENDPDPWNIIVDAANPAAEAMLSFLSHGQVQAARQIASDVLESIEQMIADKRTDPASAAIAGYYVLAAGLAQGFHSWIQSLDEWIPWLPDGAVIHAWHVMEQTKPDYKTARTRLLAAVDRGLPIYTRGLRLLFDGLRQFRFDESGEELDSAVEAALLHITPYLCATDPLSLTTSFWGKSPSEPLPLPRMESDLH